jgi:hypothetical protein
MTAPHGMCSETVARALAGVGFDALAAIHPLPWTEQAPASRLLAGWDPAEFAGPCAVIPRFTLDWTATEIALRAFLGHPIVIYGHHEDLAGGLEPLAEAALRVNRLGSVEWTSLGEIARRNYAVRIAGGTARVRPFAGRVAVTLPAAVEQVVVEAPRESAADFAGWALGDDVATVRFDVPIHRPPGPLEIRLRPADAVDLAAVKPPPWTPWPLLRRVATEARDRALPLRAA